MLLVNSFLLIKNYPHLDLRNEGFSLCYGCLLRNGSHEPTVMYVMKLMVMVAAL